MTETIKLTHDRAIQSLPFRWSMIAALLLQVFLLNAQTIANSAARLQMACEDLSIELSDYTQTCENAQACFIVQGGSPPYTVVTGNQNGGITAANPNYCFFHLEPFTDYVVTVTDAEGCTTSTELDLPGASNFDAEITNVTCNGGSDGRIEPIIPIDVAPLFYRWEGPDGFESDDEVVEGLQAGTYYLILRTTDNQCIGISHWEVTEPEPIQMSVGLNLEPCQLAAACVAVSGGTAPYTVGGYSILQHRLAGTTSVPN